MAIGWWRAGGLEGEEGVKSWLACVDAVVRLDDSELTLGFADEAEASEKEMREFMAREALLPILGETLSILIGEPCCV